jgi:hypothetical protein
MDQICQIVPSLGHLPESYLSLSLCCDCSLTATTAPSLRPARPERFPYKFQLVQVLTIIQMLSSFFYLFPKVGHNSCSGRCSRISGSSYANAASRFFLRFGGSDSTRPSSSWFVPNRWTSLLLSSLSPARWSSCSSAGFPVASRP